MIYRCSPLPLVASVSLGYHPEKLSNTLAQMLVRNRLIFINTMPTDTWYRRPYESISAEPCGPCTTLSSRWKSSLPCASYAPQQGISNVFIPVTSNGGSFIVAKAGGTSQSPTDTSYNFLMVNPFRLDTNSNCMVA
jgi:hypothetical protein